MLPKLHKSMIIRWCAAKSMNQLFFLVLLMAWINVSLETKWWACVTVLRWTLVRTTLEEFENRHFTLKTHQTLFVYTTPEILKVAGKCHHYRDAIVFEKLCFQNVFRPHENERPVRVFKFLRFEERFRKALFSWRISVDVRLYNWRK